MSVRVFTKVFAHSKATLASRLVLLALADSAHDDGITWISQSTLAEKTLISEQSVRRCLRELEKSGAIELRKAQRKRRRINVCRLVLPGLLEPDYDRLPFELDQPFTTAQDARSSNEDDRASDDGTTAHPERSPIEDEEPSMDPKGANAPSPVDPGVPPPLVHVGGRNVALDALADACSIDEDSPRYGQAVAALNGSRNQVGIRHLFWREIHRWADEHGELDRLAELHDEPERFAEALVKGIRRKAELYRTRMRGAILSPTALRDWWLDLERQQSGDGGLSASEIERMTV